MPIFRQPPQPFIGGRQPAEPRRLTPPSVVAAVDNPPPLDRRRHAPIYRAWKWRPVGAGSTVSVVAADAPPLRDLVALPQILAAWQPRGVVLMWGAILTPPSVAAPPTTIAARRGLNALGTRAGSRSHMGD